MVRVSGSFSIHHQRYGSEEFAIVLPNTHSEGGSTIAESVRKALLGLSWSRGLEPGLPSVTVSAGLATYDPRKERLDADELIRRADASMYEAKPRGRDCLVVFETSDLEPRPAADDSRDASGAGSSRQRRSTET